MTDATDMSTPVTRGELREELERLRQELDLKLAPLATKADLAPLATKADLALLATKADLAPLATKAELEIWGGALLERITSSERQLYERIESGEQRLIARIDRMQQQLQVDLARHAKALQEWMATLISAFGPEQR